MNERNAFKDSDFDGRAFMARALNGSTFEGSAWSACQREGGERRVLALARVGDRAREVEQGLDLLLGGGDRVDVTGAGDLADGG